MSGRWKRNAVVATMAVLVCAAVALNWKFTGGQAAEQEGADTATANEASESIQVLAAYTMKEAQIENLVTAKGYKDCVAFMGDESISVVVSTGTGELTAEDVAKITDIAMAETGLDAGGIKIMAAD